MLRLAFGCLLILAGLTERFALIGATLSRFAAALGALLVVLALWRLKRSQDNTLSTDNANQTQLQLHSQQRQVA